MKEIKTKGDANQLQMSISDTKELRAQVTPDEDNKHPKTRLANLASREREDSDKAKKDRKKEREKEKRKEVKEKEIEKQVREKPRRYFQANMTGLGKPNEASTYQKKSCPGCRMYCGNDNPAEQCSLFRNGQIQLKVLLERNDKHFNTLEKVNGVWRMTEKMKHNLGFMFNYKNWTKTDITNFYKDVEIGIQNLHNKDKRKDFPETNLTNQVTVKSTKVTTKATTTRDQIERAEKKLLDLQEKYNQEDEGSDDQSEVDHNRDESDDE
jgi:hypothetical protein